MQREILQGGHFLLNEDRGSMSMDNGVVKMGSGIILDGMVLGKITATGLYVPCDPAATDGSEVPYAIAHITGQEDTTLENVPIAVVVRDREVAGKELVFFPGISANDKAAQITALEIGRNIIVRN